MRVTWESNYSTTQGQELEVMNAAPALTGDILV